MAIAMGTCDDGMDRIGTERNEQGVRAYRDCNGWYILMAWMEWYGLRWRITHLSVEHG